MSKFIKEEELTDEEMEAVICKIIHKENLKLAVKGKPQSSLKSILSGLTLGQLKKQAKPFAIAGYTKADKETLEQRLFEKLTDGEFLTEIFYLLNEVEWELLKSFMQMREQRPEKLFADNYIMLLTLGIVRLHYFDGSFLMLMPDEIHKAISVIMTSDFIDEIEFAWSLNDYAVACVNLYGVITQDDFIKLYNEYNERQTNTDEAFRILIRFVCLNYGYVFWEEYLVNDFFEDDDYRNVRTYAEEAAMKPRYKPSKEEFLKYSDCDYCEQTIQITALIKFLIEEMDVAENAVYECVDELSEMFKIDLPKTQRIMDIYKSYGIEAGSAKQLEMLIALTFDMSNNTRMWANNGLTPIESSNKYINFAEKLRSPTLRTQKIGQNDPCPCGSGKKYKKCCRDELQ